MSYLLGIDVGTSGTKSVLFDLLGNTVASALSEYPMDQPKSSWAEQNPLDWWNAVCSTVNEVIRKSTVSSSEIRSVGISGQMHGLVLLDGNNQVIRPAILWCDQRTAEECEEITAIIGKKRLIELTANPALTGFTASKIMWVKKHEPQNYERCRHILLPKDYIRFMLTGEYATEVSDASGMQLLDVPNRCWSNEVLNKLGIEKTLLGKVYESQEITGKVSRIASSQTGLSVGTPVVGGAGDQAAGGVGNGIVRAGRVSATIGTSGVVFAHTDTVKIHPEGRVHTFCHAVPGAYHVMGVTQAAGLSFQWMRNNFFTTEQEEAQKSGQEINKVLDEICKKIPAGAEKLLYLPYLMGERTPHLDPYARGVFFGLSATHTKAHLLRAVMEGVVFSMMDCMRLMEEMGIAMEDIYASGGGAKSEIWRQMMADVFHKNMCLNNSAEGGALGVAILAGVGVGAYQSVSEACDEVIKTTKVQPPIEQNVPLYAEYYELYRALYGTLKDSFKVLSKIEE